MCIITQRSECPFERGGVVVIGPLAFHKIILFFFNLLLMYEYYKYQLSVTYTTEQIMHWS